MKKKLKRYGKDAMLLTGTGVTLGVGSQVVTAAGGNAGGVAAMSGYMPMMGTVVGGSHAIGLMRGGEFEMAKRRKRRRKR